MHAFRNKKPKLFGSATQAENTTGKNSDFFSGTSAVGVGKLGIQSPTTQVSTTVTTPSNSLVVVAGSCAISNAGTGPSHTVNIRILDGSTILKDGTITIGPTVDHLISILFIGIPLTGSRTYNVQVWTTTTANLVIERANIDVSHVQLTDTHDTKNINIISG